MKMAELLVIAEKENDKKLKEQVKLLRPDHNNKPKSRVLGLTLTIKMQIDIHLFFIYAMLL